MSFPFAACSGSSLLAKLWFSSFLWKSYLSSGLVAHWYCCAWTLPYQWASQITNGLHMSHSFLCPFIPYFNLKKFNFHECMDALWELFTVPHLFLPDSYWILLGLQQILYPSPSGVLVNFYWNDPKSLGIVSTLQCPSHSCRNPQEWDQNGTGIEWNKTRKSVYLLSTYYIQIDPTDTIPLLDTFTLICISAHCDFKDINTFL